MIRLWLHQFSTCSCLHNFHHEIFVVHLTNDAESISSLPSIWAHPRALASRWSLDHRRPCMFPFALQLPWEHTPDNLLEDERYIEHSHSRPGWGQSKSANSQLTPWQESKPQSSETYKWVRSWSAKPSLQEPTASQATEVWEGQPRAGEPPTKPPQMCEQ